MGGGKGTSTSTQAPPKEIMDAYKQSLGLARQAIQQPYQQYQGQMVAGLNPTQLQGIANVNAAQGAALPYIQQGASYVNQAAQGVNPQMINQFMSPYLNNVVNATQKNLMESNAQQQAAMKAGAIQSGAFGGDRGRYAQAELARQQGLAGGQVIGGLLNQGYGQALSGAQQNIQNMLQGGQMLGGLGASAQQSMLQGAQAQLAAGAQQQATEQAALQAAYDQYLQRQAYPYQQAQFFANIAQGIGAGAGGTTTQQPPAPSWASQIFGGLTALGSIGSLFPSDERVKENIVEVGKTHDGQKIYKYNYKGDHRPQIGLIAQEVEREHPDAVKTLGGIKMVDYDKATEGSERAGKAYGGSSMGGLVTPEMERQNFAQGGFGMVPYADFMKGMSWVPSGELTYKGQSPGSTLPSGFKMEDLEKIMAGSDFDEINAMSKDQLAAMKKGLGNLGSWGSDLLGSAGAPVGFSSLPPMTGTVYANHARGGVVSRHGYATDGAVTDAGGLDLPTPDELKAKIIEIAKQEGVSPDEALRVYAAEGASGDPRENWQSKIVSNGVREPSYGPFQLNMGPQGLGTAMLKETGLDPSKPENMEAGLHYALKHAAKNGWNDWMGARKIGLAGADLPSEGGVVITPAGDTTPSNDGGRSLIERITGQELSDNARMSLLAAGLGMMAGRSPYAGINIGKGGLLGMQTYYKGLENARELAKASGELGLRKMEADTSRMQAQTARQQMVRQLYMQILPLVQFYQAEGRPIPKEYQSIIDEATSLGVSNDVPAVAPADRPAPATTGQDTEAAPAPAAIEPAAATTSGPVDITPKPEATETAQSPAVAATPEVKATAETPAAADTPATQPATGTALKNANPELEKLFSQLPDDQNPYKLLEKAGRAQTFDMKQKYMEQANKLMEDYRTSGIPLPSGTVRFPGVAEAAGEQKRIEAVQEGVGKNITDFDNQISDLQSGFGSRTMIVDGLRHTLMTAETGRFSEFKADLVNAAASLGLANADQIEKAANIQTAMKYFAQGILDSGMKDKIGPQISNADLMLVAKGQGTVENLAAANRNIIGAMYGKLKWDQDRVASWDDFIAKKGDLTKISTADRRAWERQFNEDHKIMKYVEDGKANTPVAGELSVKRNASYFKPGWKYVDPRTGRVFIVKGFKEVDGKKIPDAELVQ